MKCSACQENACEGKFENKYKCLGAKEKINCTCCCQVSKTDAIRTSVLSIGAGVAAAAGGVALTMMTGGLFAVISGAALVGAGSSMVMTPIQKKIAGERMTLKLKELKTHQETLAKISGDPSLSARQKLETKQEYCKSNKLPSSKTSKHIKREINSTSKQAQSKLRYIGEKNVHALKGERTGQFAVDLAPADPKTGHRNGERGIYEIRDGKAVYVDHTADHNYDGCRKDISKLIPDPYDALRPEHINQDRIDDEENKSREKTE